MWNSEHKPSPNTLPLHSAHGHRQKEKPNKCITNPSFPLRSTTHSNRCHHHHHQLLNLDHLRPFYKSISWQNCTPINRAHHQINQMYNTWFQTLFFLIKSHVSHKINLMLGISPTWLKLGRAPGWILTLSSLTIFTKWGHHQLTEVTIMSTVLTSLMDISPSGLWPLDWTVRIECYTS